MVAIRESELANLVYRGKVRDTHDVGEGLLLMVATDRISAFDVVLPNAIPDKGVVLAQLSACWFDKTKHLVPNHMFAMGESRPDLVADPELGVCPRIRSWRRKPPRNNLLTVIWTLSWSN